MARAFLFIDDQVQSLAHTHVGSSESHRGRPLLFGHFFAFCFSPSPIGYTGSVSLSLLGSYFHPALGLAASPPALLALGLAQGESRMYFLRARAPQLVYMLCVWVICLHGNMATTSIEAQ
jgi:hypothetical protein